MRRALALALLASLSLPACSGSLLNAPRRSQAPTTRHAPRPRPVSPTPGFSARRSAMLARAGCSTAVSRAPALPGVRPLFVQVPGDPFGIAVTADGRDAFVGGISGGVGVFSLAGARPVLTRVIQLPQPSIGVSLTRDGRYLLVADGGDGAEVIDVAGALNGTAGAVLGDLSTAGSSRIGGGAIEVASSADGRFAFVSLEGAGRIAVFDLATAVADDFRTSGYVGSIQVGLAPVGLAVSPDGRWLYSTSEGGAGGRPLSGVLDVIAVREAVRDPARSLVASVPAGCSPVRVVVSADGAIVWVTARESDRLLAFSAVALRRDPAHALLASVRVGEAPVGLALVRDGAEVVVADSNRFDAPHASAGLTIVAAGAALRHRPSLLGTVRSGLFPRELAFDAHTGVLLVGDYASESLEAVALGGRR